MEFDQDQCRSKGGGDSKDGELLSSVKSALPEFPTPKDLVFNEKNTHLLAALLPTLDKHKCLESYDIYSPWVRAFWDLHCPSGPWGKYQHEIDPGNKAARYNFKNKNIPAIHNHLKQYEGDSLIHKELLRRLDEFESKKKSNMTKELRREEKKDGQDFSIVSSLSELSSPCSEKSEVEKDVSSQISSPHESKSSTTSTSSKVRIEDEDNCCAVEDNELSDRKSTESSMNIDQVVDMTNETEKDQFEKEKQQILSQIPSRVKAQFRNVGFARWIRTMILPQRPSLKRQLKGILNSQLSNVVHH